MFDQIAKWLLPADFPKQLMKAIGQFPVLPASQAATPEAFGKILERFTTVNTVELEKGALLKSLISALSQVINGYGNSSDLMEDAPVDAAAACSLVMIAALMAKDKSKPIVTMVSKTLPNSQKLVTIDISLMRN